MKKRGKGWAVALFVLWVIFIFHRSLQPAQMSDEESGRLLQLLQQILPFELSNHMVRKTAHFVEFGILGFLGWFAFFDCGKHKRIQLVLSLVPCILVALCDETIQLFVEGRARKLADVCLDTAGALAGVLAGMIVHILYCRIKKARQSDA